MVKQKKKLCNFKRTENQSKKLNKKVMVSIYKKSGGFYEENQGRHASLAMMLCKYLSNLFNIQLEGKYSSYLFLRA